MGPHSFKCGKQATYQNRDALAFQRFNGAALFQVRKDYGVGYLGRAIRCFNGAALFQVRKV